MENKIVNLFLDLCAGKLHITLVYVKTDYEPKRFWQIRTETAKQPVLVHSAIDL